MGHQKKACVKTEQELDGLVSWERKELEMGVGKRTGWLFRKQWRGGRKR